MPSIYLTSFILSLYFIGAFILSLLIFWVIVLVIWYIFSWARNINPTKDTANSFDGKDVFVYFPVILFSVLQLIAFPFILLIDFADQTFTFMNENKFSILLITFLWIGASYGNLYQQQTLTFIDSTYRGYIAPIVRSFLPLVSFARLIIYDLAIGIWNLVNAQFKVVRTITMQMLVSCGINNFVAVTKTAGDFLLTFARSFGQWIASGIVQNPLDFFSISKSLFKIFVDAQNILLCLCYKLGPIFNIVTLPFEQNSISYVLNGTVNYVLWAGYRSIFVGLESNPVSLPNVTPGFLALQNATYEAGNFTNFVINNTVAQIWVIISNLAIEPQTLQNTKPTLFQMQSFATLFNWTFENFPQPSQFDTTTNNFRQTVNIPPIACIATYPVVSALSILNITLEALIHVDKVIEGIFSSDPSKKALGQSYFNFSEVMFPLYQLQGCTNGIFFPIFSNLPVIYGISPIPGQAIRIAVTLIDASTQLGINLIYNIITKPLDVFKIIRSVWNGSTIDNFFDSLNTLMDQLAVFITGVVTHLFHAFSDLFASAAKLVVKLIRFLLDILLNFDNVLAQLVLPESSNNYITSPNSTYTLRLNQTFDQAFNLSATAGQLLSTFGLQECNSKGQFTYCGTGPNQTTSTIYDITCTISQFVKASLDLIIVLIQQINLVLIHTYGREFCNIIPNWQRDIRPYVVVWIKAICDLAGNVLATNLQSCPVQCFSLKISNFGQSLFDLPLFAIDLSFEIIIKVQNTIIGQCTSNNTPYTAFQILRDIITKIVTALVDILTSLSQLIVCFGNNKDSNFFILLANIITKLAAALSDLVLPLLLDTIQLVVDILSFNFAAFPGDFIKFMKDFGKLLLDAVVGFFNFFLNNIVSIIIDTIKFIIFQPLCIFCEIISKAIHFLSVSFSNPSCCTFCGCKTSKCPCSDQYCAGNCNLCGNNCKRNPFPGPNITVVNHVDNFFNQRMFKEEQIYKRQKNPTFDEMFNIHMHGINDRERELHEMFENIKNAHLSIDDSTKDDAVHIEEIGAGYDYVIGQKDSNKVAKDNAKDKNARKDANLKDIDKKSAIKTNSMNKFITYNDKFTNKLKKAALKRELKQRKYFTSSREFTMAFSSSQTQKQLVSQDLFAKYDQFYIENRETDSTKQTSNLLFHPRDYTIDDLRRESTDSTKKIDYNKYSEFSDDPDQYSKYDHNLLHPMACNTGHCRYHENKNNDHSINKRTISNLFGHHLTNENSKKFYTDLFDWYKSLPNPADRSQKPSKNQKDSKNQENNFEKYLLKYGMSIYYILNENPEKFDHMISLMVSTLSKKSDDPFAEEQKNLLAQCSLITSLYTKDDHVSDPTHEHDSTSHTKKSKEASKSKKMGKPTFTNHDGIDTSKTIHSNMTLINFEKFVHQRLSNPEVMSFCSSFMETISDWNDGSRCALLIRSHSDKKWSQVDLVDRLFISQCIEQRVITKMINNAIGYKDFLPKNILYNIQSQIQTFQDVLKGLQHSISFSFKSFDPSMLLLNDGPYISMNISISDEDGVKSSAPLVDICPLFKSADKYSVKKYIISKYSKHKNIVFKNAFGDTHYEKDVSKMEWNPERDFSHSRQTDSYYYFNMEEFMKNTNDDDILNYIYLKQCTTVSDPKRTMFLYNIFKGITSNVTESIYSIVYDIPSHLMSLSHKLLNTSNDHLLNFERQRIEDPENPIFDGGKFSYQGQSHGDFHYRRNEPIVNRLKRIVGNTINLGATLIKIWNSNNLTDSFFETVGDLSRGVYISITDYMKDITKKKRQNQQLRESRQTSINKRDFSPFTQEEIHKGDYYDDISKRLQNIDKIQKRLKGSKDENFLTIPQNIKNGDKLIKQIDQLKNELRTQNIPMRQMKKEILERRNNLKKKDFSKDQIWNATKIFINELKSGPDVINKNSGRGSCLGPDCLVPLQSPTDCLLLDAIIDFYINEIDTTFFYYSVCFPISLQKFNVSMVNLYSQVVPDVNQTCPMPPNFLTSQQSIDQFSSTNYSHIPSVLVQEFFGPNNITVTYSGFSFNNVIIDFVDWIFSSVFDLKKKLKQVTQYIFDTQAENYFLGKNGGSTRGIMWYVDHFLGCSDRRMLYCSDPGRFGLWKGFLIASAIVLGVMLFNNFLFELPVLTNSILIFTIYIPLILGFAYLWSPLCVPQLPSCLADDIYDIINTKIFPITLHWGCALADHDANRQQRNRQVDQLSVKPIYSSQNSSQFNYTYEEDILCSNLSNIILEYDNDQGDDSPLLNLTFPLLNLSTPGFFPLHPVNPNQSFESQTTFANSTISRTSVHQRLLFICYMRKLNSYPIERPYPKTLFNPPQMFHWNSTVHRQFVNCHHDYGFLDWIDNIFFFLDWTFPSITHFMRTTKIPGLFNLFNDWFYIRSRLQRFNSNGNPSCSQKFCGFYTLDNFSTLGLFVLTINYIIPIFTLFFVELFIAFGTFFFTIFLSLYVMLTQIVSGAIHHPLNKTSKDPISYSPALNQKIQPVGQQSNLTNKPTFVKQPKPENIPTQSQALHSGANIRKRRN